MATLSYAYAESTVHLEVLAAESHPMTHDLCGRHADAVSVPRGWNLEDDRPSHADATPTTGTDANGVRLRLVGA